MKGRVKIISCALLYSIVFSCNTAKPQVTFDTHIDDEIKEYVEEFIVEGKKRGFNAEPYIKIIDSIRINYDMEYGYLGLYTPKTHEKFNYFYGTVDISPINMSSKMLLKSTVFHELGHVCGYQGHPCDLCPDIMSSVTRINLEDKDIKDKVSWDAKVDVLFKQIKAIPIEHNPVRRYVDENIRK